MEYTSFDIPEPSGRPLHEQLIEASWSWESTNVFRADFLLLDDRTKRAWIKLHEGYVQLAAAVSMTGDELTKDRLNADLAREGFNEVFSISTMNKIICIVQHLDFDVHTHSIFEINFSANRISTLLFGDTFSDEDLPSTWSPF